MMMSNPIIRLNVEMFASLKPGQCFNVLSLLFCTHMILYMYVHPYVAQESYILFILFIQMYFCVAIDIHFT